MSREKLRCVAPSVVESLRDNIAGNLPRYLSGDFKDLAAGEDWSRVLQVEGNLEPLSRLDTAEGPKSEIINSLLVWQALSHLPAALATEAVIWTRLTHCEGLKFSRARWIRGMSGPQAEKTISTHFFADTRTQCRDDNAIGRLWWNAYIARIAMPDDHAGALKQLLKSADIRSNIVERAWVSSRPPVLRALMRAMNRRPEATATEQAFRDFMKSVNRRGGGILFEAMTEVEVDGFMDQCVAR